MTPERWAETKDMLARALDLAEPERDAFLRQACGEDRELREEVTSLLAAAVDEDSLPTVRAAIAAAAALVMRGRPEEQSANDSATLALLETALGTQYEIIRPLGRGGMGAVYLARERALERFVAIKVLRPDLATVVEGRERFRREARVVAHLSHPNILPLHTFGEVHGVWYFVMGYVRGTSLAERLRVEGALPSADAHRILTELADAVECAHKHGVVHRDIKPANILLDEESGHAVLADFGISKVSGADDSLTATGAVVGTPHFMSPEQALGLAVVDERSDIYSLGAVGYMMLTGREPFAGTPARELAVRRMSQPPPALQAAAPTVPAELAEVVMTCLAPDPGARWPDAGALRKALARAGDDRGALLSEGLRDLPTFGPYATLWAVFWTAAALLTRREPADRALLLLIAFLVPFGFWLHIWNIGRYEGDTWRVARIAFWPPTWWGMWWPASLRRPSDLWIRLPWPARAIRRVLSAFIIALAGLILLRRELERAIGSFASSPAPVWFVRLEVSLVLSTAALTAFALWWSYRRGLSRSEAVRVLFGATIPSPGWNVPVVAQLLRPASETLTRTPRHDSPADHRRAIADAARRLAFPSEARDHLAHVSDSLIRSIEECDAEIATLSRNANVTELDRLASQLASLESEDATHERRELCDLVRRQLEVVRRMRIRCELVAQRRTTLFSHLRGIWTSTNQLHDELAAAPASSTNQRVRAICADAERALTATMKGDEARRPTMRRHPPAAADPAGPSRG